MFYGATEFDGDLSKWNTGAVVRMDVRCYDECNEPDTAEADNIPSLNAMGAMLFYTLA